MFQLHQFVSYLNGQTMPHRQALALLQEKAAGSAGGFYDHERTFNGRAFKVRQHLERLYNGLAATKIEPSINVDEMEAISQEILEANLPLLNPGDEFEITQVVNLIPPASPDDKPSVNVFIYCEPVAFAPFARSYVDGASVITPVTYGVPSGREPSSAAGGARRVFQLMVSQEGYVTECKGGNFMFVRDGRIKLPDRTHVLPGVSMHTVLELAETLGIGVDEGDYSNADIYEADEIFLSATMYCIVPVATMNGYKLADPIPGPVTAKLMDAWREMVGMDFVQQALDHLPAEGIGDQSGGPTPSS
jgi:branched-chain amino acid aminotransferase